MPSLFVVTIYGGAGAGKSTLAKAVVSLLGDDFAARVPADYFLLPRSALSAAQTASGLHYDWPRLSEALSAPLGARVSTPRFDFTRLERDPAGDTREFTRRQVMIVDAMIPYPGADLRVLVTCDPEQRRARVAARDLVWQTRVNDRWDHLEQTMAEAEPTVPMADLVIDGSRPVAANAPLIADFIRSHSFRSGSKN